MNNVPRSIRNNNPFNIKKSSSRWIGKVKGDDKVFETFDTLEHGIRAGLKLLINYVQKGYNTPRKIIMRFAPPSENATSSYLSFVCDYGSIFPDKVITPDDFIQLCFRIIRYESGLSAIELLEYGINICTLQQIYIKFNLKF